MPLIILIIILLFGFSVVWTAFKAVAIFVLFIGGTFIFAFFATCCCFCSPKFRAAHEKAYAQQQAKRKAAK